MKKNSVNKKEVVKTKTQEDSRSLLLDAAKKAFALHGYDGTGVREIAELSGVNIGSISYYFEGKEGLFKACLESFGKSNVASAERVLKHPNSVEEYRTRLEIFIMEFLDLHLREKDVCMILHREAVTNPLVHEVFETSFSPMMGALEKFFVHAQKKDIVRKNADPIFLCFSLIGTMTHSIKFYLSPMKMVDANKKTVVAPTLEKMTADLVMLWCDGTLAR